MPWIHVIYPVWATLSYLRFGWDWGGCQGPVIRPGGTTRDDQTDPRLRHQVDTNNDGAIDYNEPLNGISLVSIVGFGGSWFRYFEPYIENPK